MLRERTRRPRVFARAIILCLAVLVCVVWTAPVTAGTWKGKETNQEGVLHVMNPSEGMEPATTVELQELWRLGGDTDDEDEFFGVIVRITTDDQGNIYVLDSQLSEVKIYDPNGEYLNTIGREGEGPGEFRRANDMFFLPDGNIGVMQLVPGKIVMLSPEGDPLGNYPLPEPEGGGFQVLRGGKLAGGKLVLVRQLQTRGENELVQAITLDQLDADGNVSATLVSQERKLVFSNLLIDEKRFFTFDQGGRWDVGTDGRVYVLNSYLDYKIHVFNPDGTLDRVIEREYARRKRTSEEVERIENIWAAFLRQAPGAKTDIGEFDFDVRSIHPRDDGSLWALTSRGARDGGEGVVGVFDVFDDQGRFVREVTLKGQGDAQEDGYFFVGDRLYVVTGFLDAILAQQGGAVDAEEEEDAMPMEIICYRVDAPVVAKSE